MLIKYIIFDLGGIVVPEADDLIQQRIAHFLGIGTSELERLTKDLKPKVTTGEITLRDLYAEILNQLGKKDIESDTVLKKHLEFFKKCSTTRNQEVLDIVKKLKRRYSVVCLTNTEIEVTDFNRKNGLYDYFDKAYISTEMRMRKPNPEIYRTVLNNLNCEAKEVVFIDDKPEYVEGAKRVGINGIVYENIEQLKRELISLSINVY